MRPTPATISPEAIPPSQYRRFRATVQGLNATLFRGTRLYDTLTLASFTALVTVARLDGRTLLVRCPNGDHGAIRDGQWLGFAPTAEDAADRLTRP